MVLLPQNWKLKTVSCSGSVKLKERCTLYLCAYYRPNVADETSLRKLGQSLGRASQLPKAHLLIGGDFNFPGWDWQTTPTLKPRAPYPGLHHDLINDHGLEQLVREPTREDNTQDLYLTNCPQLIPRTEVIPGLSDHKIPYCEFIVNTTKKKQAQHEVPVYAKANWTSLKEVAVNLSSTIVQSKDTTVSKLVFYAQSTGVVISG